MKKAWSKPQLIVLHRDTAEAVLAVCKHTSTYGGPTNADTYCYALSAPCVVCSAQGAS
jgi:hypothetical protein